MNTKYMNTHPIDITTDQIDLTLELRSANGSSTEFYQAEEASVRETLRLLAAPQLFAQPRLLLASQHCASIIPCRGIDMILVRTFARTPLKFPLNLPQGLFDIVEQPEAWADNQAAAIEDQNVPPHGPPHRRNLQVEIHTLGGWTVTLKAAAVIRGNVQDERHLFAHLSDVPTIPFRLPDGGFGLINTANIMRASVWPKPEALSGVALPLALRRWTPARSKSPANLAEATQS
jgi:hypothetical protein